MLEITPYGMLLLEAFKKAYWIQDTRKNALFLSSSSQWGWYRTLTYFFKNFDRRSMFDMIYRLRDEREIYANAIGEEEEYETKVLFGVNEPDYMPLKKSLRIFFKEHLPSHTFSKFVFDKEFDELFKQIWRERDFQYNCIVTRVYEKYIDEILDKKTSSKLHRNMHFDWFDSCGTTKFIQENFGWKNLNGTYNFHELNNTTLFLSKGLYDLNNLKNVDCDFSYANPQETLTYDYIHH